MQIRTGGRIRRNKNQGSERNESNDKKTKYQEREAKFQTKPRKKIRNQNHKKLDRENHSNTNYELTKTIGEAKTNDEMRNR